MTTAYTNHYVVNGTAATNYTILSCDSSGPAWYVGADAWEPIDPSLLTLADHVRQVRMRDGSVIHVDEHGNFRVEDKDAKVTYLANRRKEFNPYVNAGDLLARFVDFVRETAPSVRRADMAQLPIELFMQWLVLEAASQDGDPVPVGVEPLPRSRLLVARVHPRCVLPTCRRFIRRVAAQAGFNYCKPEHAIQHRALLAAA